MGRNGLDIPTIAGYLGAKTRLVPALIDLIAKANGTTMYGELFGGMGATLLNKPPHSKEIYNDLSVENYSIFKCFASPDLSNAFIDRILESEYSKGTYDFYRAKYDTEFSDKVSDCFGALQAGELPEDLLNWREENLLELGVTSLVLTKMSPRGLISAKSFAGYYTGLEEQEYENWKLNLYTYADRLKNVEVLNRDALSILRENADNPNAIFLCDSPYNGENANYDPASYNPGAAQLRNEKKKQDKEGWKKSAKQIAKEADDKFQKAYMSTIQHIKCKVIVCGYDNDFYPQYLTEESGWTKHLMGELSKSAKNNGLGEMRDRVEEWVWVNYDIL